MKTFSKRERGTPKEISKGSREGRKSILEYGYLKDQEEPESEERRGRENTADPPKIGLTKRNATSKQMILKLGRKVYGSCPTCGMLYSSASKKEIKLHLRYHEIINKQQET